MLFVFRNIFIILFAFFIFYDKIILIKQKILGGLIMEFKKCMRCGCFFMSDNNVCCNCESKDRMDISKLNSILDETNNFNSVQDLSILSGVNMNNLNRFIANKQISDLDINL